MNYLGKKGVGLRPFIDVSNDPMVTALRLGFQSTDFDSEALISIDRESEGRIRQVTIPRVGRLGRSGQRREAWWRRRHVTGASSCMGDGGES